MELIHGEEELRAERVLIEETRDLKNGEQLCQIHTQLAECSSSFTILRRHDNKPTNGRRAKEQHVIQGFAPLKRNFTNNCTGQPQF